MVVARLELENNLTVLVSTLSSPEALKGSALKAYKKLKEYKSRQSEIKVKINNG